jgi:hypothetical protein
MKLPSFRFIFLTTLILLLGALLGILSSRDWEDDGGDKCDSGEFEDD